MPVNRRSTVNNYNPATGTVTLTFPATVAGELVVVHAGDATNAGPSILTGGYTPAGTAQLSGPRGVRAFWRLSPGGETQVQVTGSDTSASVTTYTGARQSNPVPAFSQTSNGKTTGSLSSDTVGAKLVHLGAVQNSARSLAAPDGMGGVHDLTFGGNSPRMFVSEETRGTGPTGSRTNGGSASEFDSASTMLLIAGDPPNADPTAPTNLNPGGGVTFDRTGTRRFSWQFNDPNPGDTQSRYELQYRRVGVTAWTTVAANLPSTFHDFAGGTFAAGDYEWQVRAFDSQGRPSPWSSSAFFTAATPPPGPTITDPLDGQTISTNRAPLSWSYPTQSAYQVRVLDEANAVVYDSGIVGGTTGAQTRTVQLDYPVNNVTRKPQVRIQDSGTGLWSTYSTVTVTVSYTPPAKPSVLVIPSDSGASISVLVSHPTPTGTQPAVAATEVEVRADNPGDPYRPHGLPVRLVLNSTTLTDGAVTSGVAYSYRARAVGVNQTATYSEWTP